MSLLRPCLRCSPEACAGLAVLIPLVLSAGCELIAGIDDKTLASAGAGGSTGVTAASAGGGVGGGVGGGGGGGGHVDGDPLCAPGAPTKACSGTDCVPTIMVNGLPGVEQVATNGHLVFFASHNADYTAGGLYRLRLDADSTTMPELLAMADPQTGIEAVAADCNDVYYVERQEDPQLSNLIYRIPGGADPSRQMPGVHVLVAALETDVRRIVANGSVIAWASMAGGVASIKTHNFANSSDGMLSVGLSPVAGLAIDTQFVYWSVEDTSIGEEGVWRVAILPGSPPLGTPERIFFESASAIALDSDRIYALSRADGTLYKAMKSDTEVSPQAVADLSGLGSSYLGDALAVDDLYLYWSGDQEVYKCLKDDGQTLSDPILLAESGGNGVVFPEVHWLTIDRSRVYFASPDATSSRILWVGK